MQLVVYLRNLERFSATSGTGVYTLRQQLHSNFWENISMDPPLQISELRRMAALFRNQTLFNSAESIDRQIVDYIMKHNIGSTYLSIAYFELAESLVGQEKHLEAHFYYDRAAAMWEQTQRPADAARICYNETLQSIADEAGKLGSHDHDAGESHTA